MFEDISALIIAALLTINLILVLIYLILTKEIKSTLNAIPEQTKMLVQKVK